MAIHVGVPGSTIALAKTISDGYADDPECEGSPSRHEGVYHLNYTNGLWYKDDRVYVPAAARDTIMRLGHGMGLRVILPLASRLIISNVLIGGRRCWWMFPTSSAAVLFVRGIRL